jgi:hypothetical protein
MVSKSEESGGVRRDLNAKGAKGKTPQGAKELTLSFFALVLRALGV